MSLIATLGSEMGLRQEAEMYRYLEELVSEFRQATDEICGLDAGLRKYQ